MEKYMDTTKQWNYESEITFKQKITGSQKTKLLFFILRNKPKYYYRSIYCKKNSSEIVRFTSEISRKVFEIKKCFLKEKEYYKNGFISYKYSIEYNDIPINLIDYISKDLKKKEVKKGFSCFIEEESYTYRITVYDKYDDDNCYKNIKHYLSIEIEFNNDCEQSLNIFKNIIKNVSDYIVNMI